MREQRIMYKHENRAIFILALIMSFRMLGLFMILPVFSVAAATITGATPKLIGFAIGAYGLTQAALQIPFGAMSDKIGRKPIIILGLILFIIGSIVAATSHTMTGIIIGRAIQGGGAIGSTVMALLADLTRDEGRTKAMAIMGLSIGCAFSIALIVGTLLNHFFGLSGIFFATAIFGAIGILLLLLVPQAPKIVAQSKQPALNLLRNPSLIRLDFSIFSLHAILTAIFIALPLVLYHKLNMSSEHTILMYLAVLVIAFILMVPFIIIAEKRRLLKQTMLAAIVVIAASSFLLNFAQNTWEIMIILSVFFTAFSLMEASLPSLVSKIAPIAHRGSAMGLYSSAQFSGIFVGGLIGGLLLSKFGVFGIFSFAALLAIAWGATTLSLPEPPYLSTIVCSQKDLSKEQIEQIKATEGIADIFFNPEEELLIVKIDKKIITENDLQKKIKSITLGDQT